MGFMRSMLDEPGDQDPPQSVFEVIFSGSYDANYLRDEIVAKLYVGNAPADSELRYQVPDHLSVGALLLDEEFNTRIRARLIDEYLTRNCR